MRIKVHNSLVRYAGSGSRSFFVVINNGSVHKFMLNKIYADIRDYQIEIYHGNKVLYFSSDSLSMFNNNGRRKGLVLLRI